MLTLEKQDVFLDFSVDGPPQSPFARSDEATLASERLRKAIERNRAKQMRRESRQPEQQASLWDQPETRTRRGVATPNNTEFATDIEVARAKPPVPINYVSAKRKVGAKRKKKAQVAPWLKGTPLDYFVKACWVFAAVLLGRLIFSSGGVVDYYQKKNLIERKQYEMNLIVKENSELMLELEAMRTDQTFQRKLVRDHLGFIARDEYLILFQNEPAGPSI